MIAERQQGTSSVRQPAADGGDGDEPVFVGQCGRPVDVECGLIDPLTCVTHGPALLANDDDASDEAKSLHRQIARQRFLAMRGEHRSARQRIATLEQLLGPGTQAEVQSAIAAERRRSMSRSMIAAVASARLQRW
jgi:hypothetical protein